MVGDSFVKFIQGTFERGNFPKSINSILISLIPKVETPEVYSQFRPISLCSVAYKAITKVLANRLRLALPKLIQEGQSSFIPGKQITKNIIITQEVIHTM